MVKIRICAPIAGDHGDHPADSVVSFPPHVARQILDSRMGVAVGEEADPVADEPGETEPEAPAATRPARGKKGKKSTEGPAAPATVGLDESEWTTE